MAEQTQVLSMQMVSCEERLARSEADLRVEREWRNSLQTREVQLKEQITGYKLEIRDLMEDRRLKIQLEQDLDALQKRYRDSERTLEELGMQLSVSKLKIVDLKEKQSAASGSTDVSDGNPNWTPDKMITACRGCARDFSITRRKHHCRNCGHIFCNSCSENMAVLPKGGSGQSAGKSVRVCLSCFRKINSSEP